MRNIQALRFIDHNYGVFGAGPLPRPLRRGRRTTVQQWERGVLLHHGRLENVLEPGAHRRWGSGFTVHVVDMRPWVLVVPTQEVPAADGVSVKITVSAQVVVVDPVAYVSAVRCSEQALYLAVQVALRELVASMTVDELLTSRADAGRQLLEGVRGLDGVGLTVAQLELKDIILPSELKRAQAEVLVARAHGAAALERARGETAALRSLANAARLAADNPAMLQLRLLQQLESSTGHTVVIGGAPFGTTPAL